MLCISVWYTLGLCVNCYAHSCILPSSPPSDDLQSSCDQNLHGPPLSLAIWRPPTSAIIVGIWSIGFVGKLLGFLPLAAATMLFRLGSSQASLGYWTRYGNSQQVHRSGEDKPIGKEQVRNCRRQHSQHFHCLKADMFGFWVGQDVWKLVGLRSPCTTNLWIREYIEILFFSGSVSATCCSFPHLLVLICMPSGRFLSRSISSRCMLGTTSLRCISRFHEPPRSFSNRSAGFVRYLTDPICWFGVAEVQVGRLPIHHDPRLSAFVLLFAKRIVAYFYLRRLLSAASRRANV